MTRRSTPFGVRAEIRARALGLACSLLLCCAGIIRPARAEEPRSATEEQKKECETLRLAPSRVVNGHRFIPFQIVTWGLVTTRFAAVTSAGGVWTNMDSNDSTPLVTLQESFQFEWAMLRWLALEGQLLGSMATATDLSGILETGASYGYGGKLALVGRFIERGAFYLSGRLDGEEQRYQSIVPQRALDAVDISTSGVSVSRPRIADSGRLYRVRPSLNLAVGIAPWWGWQLSAAVNVDTRNPERGDTGVYTTLDLGLGTAFDLNQIHVPVTLMVGGRALHDFGATMPWIPALQPSGQNRGQVEVALYYSGRPGLDLGLSVRTDVGGSQASLLVSPVINYIW